MFKFLTSLFLALLLAACDQQPQKVEQTFYVFGTAVNIEIIGAPPQKSQTAIQAIEADFHQFNQEWHAWEKGGLISKINQAIADRQPIEIPQPVKAFIIKTQQLSKASNYLFDPAIGGLVDLWGFHSEDWQGPPPNQTKIDHWLKNRPSIADIYFEDNWLYSKNSNVRLDFGGNAKGLALDRAINTLKQSGINNAIVNIGGDMRIIGFKNPEKHQAWSIGVRNPFTPEQPIGRVELSNDASIVTSGSYQRYFEWQGKRYSHIINPNTGYPADNFVSVTVIHPDATTADSAATALMIAGPKHWQEIAQKMGIKTALMIDQQGKFYQTESMQKQLKSIN